MDDDFEDDLLDGDDENDGNFLPPQNRKPMKPMSYDDNEEGDVDPYDSSFWGGDEPGGGRTKQGGGSGSGGGSGKKQPIDDGSDDFDFLGGLGGGSGSKPIGGSGGIG